MKLVPRYQVEQPFRNLIRLAPRDTLVRSDDRDNETRPALFVDERETAASRGVNLIFFTAIPHEIPYFLA
jgi:hypothetical protein